MKANRGCRSIIQFPVRTRDSAEPSSGESATREGDIRPKLPIRATVSTLQTIGSDVRNISVHELDKTFPAGSSHLILFQIVTMPPRRHGISCLVPESRGPKADSLAFLSFSNQASRAAPEKEKTDPRGAVFRVSGIFLLWNERNCLPMSEFRN
jgi:hypothetical protein